MTLEQLLNCSADELKKLTDAELAEWKKAMEPVYKRFEADIGVDLIKAAASHSNKK